MTIDSSVSIEQAQAGKVSSVEEFWAPVLRMDPFGATTSQSLRLDDAVRDLGLNNEHVYIATFMISEVRIRRKSNVQIRGSDDEILAACTIIASNGECVRNKNDQRLVRTLGEIASTFGAEYGKVKTAFNDIVSAMPSLREKVLLEDIYLAKRNVRNLVRRIRKDGALRAEIDGKVPGIVPNACGILELAKEKGFNFAAEPFGETAAKAVAIVLDYSSVNIGHAILAERSHLAAEEFDSHLALFRRTIGQDRIEEQMRRDAAIEIDRKLHLVKKFVVDVMGIVSRDWIYKKHSSSSDQALIDGANLILDRAKELGYGFAESPRETAAKALATVLDDKLIKLDRRALYYNTHIGPEGFERRLGEFRAFLNK
ncbi:MAG: hypothetical protein KGH60_03185 [Candidatus Micrarchaeota archaeon]|nr:hypothetical protein [Candidatus Micrarchaeota archaeon]